MRDLLVTWIAFDTMSSIIIAISAVMVLIKIDCDKKVNMATKFVSGMVFGLGAMLPLLNICMLYAVLINHELFRESMTKYYNYIK